MNAQENPFDLVRPMEGDQTAVTQEDMQVVMDEIRSVVRGSHTSSPKGKKLDAALELFDARLKEELRRISGSGSSAEDLVCLLPQYVDSLSAHASEGLRIHLTGFFREQGIHFDRSVFAPQAVDKETEYIRSLYIQAFVLSILDYRHLLKAETKTDELAALKLAIRYGYTFVQEYFHGSYIRDTLNKRLGKGEKEWSEEEVAELFQDSVRKQIAVGNTASIEGTLGRIAANVRQLRDNAWVAATINRSITKEEEKWSEEEVAELFRDWMRKYIAVGNIASIERGLGRIAANVRQLRDNAWVTKTINESVKNEEEKWSEKEVAELFQGGMRKRIAVHNIASIERGLKDLNGLMQTAYMRRNLSKDNIQLLAKKGIVITSESPTKAGDL